ncbi:major facilitator superfamily domain-containing protein [Cladorrhinum sp. PSN332]|nr:major facilitator superfamily domain-containing protein [Cladorrhinum sp. PSN332]
MAAGPDLRDTTADTDTEHTPLLSPSTQEDATTATNDDDLRTQLRAPVTFLAFTVLFLLELSAGMVVAPTSAIMESIICRHLHPDQLLPGENLIRHFAGNLILIDDPICKSPDVQGRLAMLRAWGYTFECLPGILLSVPYGLLSDKWGRRPVMMLSLLGIVLGQVFTYFVYFWADYVPLWSRIGGGATIMVAMLYTIIADVVPVTERATVFFQLTACFLTSQMIAGPLGGVMMRRDPWDPLMASLGFFALSGLVLWALPETLRVHDHKNTDVHQEEEEEEEEEETSSSPDARKVWEKVCAGVGDLSRFILGNKSLVFLMLSLTFIILGRFVGEVLLQYSTKRYDWSWSDASFVLTIRSAVSLVNLLALMPIASWFCLRRLGMTGMAKDLWLGRLSAIIAVTGCLVIASAANGYLFCVGLVWFALGSGLTPLIRSLLNSLVEEHHIGTMNTLIGFMETVGLTMAGPVLAKSLEIGLDLGGPWIGLPLIIADGYRSHTLPVCQDAISRSNLGDLREYFPNLRLPGSSTWNNGGWGHQWWPYYGVSSVERLKVNVIKVMEAADNCFLYAQGIDCTARRSTQTPRMFSFLKKKQKQKKKKKLRGDRGSPGSLISQGLLFASACRSPGLPRIISTGA